MYQDILNMLVVVVGIHPESGKASWEVFCCPYILGASLDSYAPMAQILLLLH